ncbi:hypothetical protein [Reinekea sp. G2M2-21]|uniref:hypothetical protein n=1 Tax=Reinekea sp. G2M2-21 TaxID=2788942 RepID=UPI0018A9F217|nr:hypothetical protein [Reinekea sp. G2M2-21]
MALEDYVIASDKFEVDDKAIRNGFGFPCNVCSHQDKDQHSEPCDSCGHNLNTRSLETK